jgi:tetratricopeptide (TPR) repeat protein
MSPGQQPSRTRWDRLDEIFVAVADLPTAERAAALDRLCGSDAALRVEAESLLSYDTDSTKALGGVIGQAAASFAADQPAVGSRFGPYHVIRVLGIGGMGAVFLAARADDQFHKQVAIKLIKRGMDGAAVVARFRNERQILAGLDHPYIARLLDGGTTADGLPFFVMEYVQGQPVDRYCETTGLSVEQVCRLFRKLCEAVAYAHRNLVVHRDLKPGNVLITADGTPKLLDFGIAKILTSGPDAPSPEHAAVTAETRVMTPEYASPEQVRGSSVTTATDVYALGVMLYRLLSGQMPYRLEGLSLAETEAAICDREPPRPSAAAPAKLRRRLEGDLDNIVLKAIHKERERRYPSVEAFSEDLVRHLDGLPVTARPDTALYRAGKFLRRHRVAAAATALAGLSLVAGAVVATLEARRAREAQRVAEARLGQMTELANTSMLDLYDSIERLPGTTEVRKQMVATTLQFFDRLAKTSGADPKVQDVLSSAYMRLGDVEGMPGHPNLGDTAGAAETYQKALVLLQQTPAQLPTGGERLKRESELYYRLGEVMLRLGRLDQAEQHERKALALTERIAAANPSDGAWEQVASAGLNLARILEQSKPGDGLPFSNKATAIDEELARRNPADLTVLRELSVAYGEQGRSYYTMHRLSQSLERYQKAITMRERLAAAKPGDTQFERNLMLAYAHAGDVLSDPRDANVQDLQGARVYYRKAVSIAEKMAAADRENNNAQIDLMAALYHQGTVDRDPKYRRESLAILRRAAALADSLQERDPSNAFVAKTRAEIEKEIASR